jgi:serine/threonine-protein kinase
MEQAWAAWDDRATTDDTRAWERLSDEAYLAAHYGEFSRAADFASRAAELVAQDSNGKRHARPTKLLVQVALETGDVKGAAALADAFVKRAGVWTMTETGAFDKDAADLPWLLHVAYLGHKLSRVEFEDGRRAWVERWRTSVQPGWAWVVGYAQPADTREEALAALEEAPAFAPLPAFFVTNVNPELPVGRVYALAGRLTDAELHLLRAAKNCTRLDDPFAHPRAELELGLVREAMHQNAAACEAYRAVVAQWGSAKPPSVSAAPRALGSGDARWAARGNTLPVACGILRRSRWRASRRPSSRAPRGGCTGSSLPGPPRSRAASGRSRSSTARRRARSGAGSPGTASRARSSFASGRG